MVPADWRHKVFYLVHGLSYPSVHASQKQVVAKFIWHSHHKQVGIWAKACIPCQTYEFQWHISAPLATFHVPLRHFNHVNGWSPSHVPADTFISRPWWTVLPNGQKQFSSRITLVPEHWSHIGFPILVFLRNVV